MRPAVAEASAFAEATADKTAGKRVGRVRALRRRVGPAVAILLR